MKKKIKRLGIPLLVLSILLCQLCAQVLSAPDGDESIQIVLSIEKFTLGQGYIVKPTLLTVEKGVRASIVMRDYFLDQGLTYNYGVTDEVSYISSIQDEDPGMNALAIPPQIMTALETKGDPYDQPFVLRGREHPQYLGAFDYSGWSGWMYAVNGRFPNVGQMECVMQDGDVMRWQFTVYGYGADLNPENGIWGLDPLTKFAEKEKLTYSVALLRSHYADEVLEQNDVYSRVMETLCDWYATQADVDRYQAELYMEYPEVFAHAEKPALTKDLETETVRVGYKGTLDLSVEAQVGEGTLSYQWYRGDSADLYAGEPIPQANASSYSPPTRKLWHSVLLCGGAQPQREWPKLCHYAAGLCYRSLHERGTGGFVAPKRKSARGRL